MTHKYRWIIGIAAVATAAAAYAAETIKFIYDGRGRLIRVEHTGSANNGVMTNYTIDRADNRTNKTTTGAP